MKWSEEEALFLDQAARRLEQKLGRRVTRQDVVHALVALAIQDQVLYEPSTPQLPDPHDVQPTQLPELVHSLQASPHPSYPLSKLSQ